VIEICIGGIIFVLLIGGLGLPVVAGLRLSASERLGLGTAAGVLILYLFAWAVYVTGFPNTAFLALPVAVVVMTLHRRSALRVFWRELDARMLAVYWLILSGWCLGWLALVRNYSGGEWVGDWLEHYHRVRFFLDRLPLSTRFLNLYPLPARPPLANLALTPFLALTQASFAYYQVFLTLFSTLAFFPAALLARRFQGQVHGDPAAWLLLLFMLSPLFVENATFAWTKLPAAFYVLCGLYFSREHGKTASLVAIACLAAAVLTHYSAAPYVLAMAACMAWSNRDTIGQPHKWRHALPHAGVAVGLVATWFVWSAWHFGRETFVSNTAIDNSEGLNWAGLILRRCENFCALVIPHPLRSADYRALIPDTWLGWWRDYFFNLYQTNLLFAFGTGGLVALGMLGWRHRRELGRFWGWFILLILLLHTAVISWPDRWGSVHIGLQPVVLLGLSWIAASMPSFGRGIKIVLGIGLSVDLLLGIVFQFVVQHVDLSAVYLGHLGEESTHFYGFPASSNFLSKAAWRLRFAGDTVPSVWPVATILGLLLILATRLAARVDGTKSE
jgi:hypothetical protein